MYWPRVDIVLYCSMLPICGSWTLLFMTMLFLGGVQMISIGILGEYVGRIYRETKRRPLYVVQQRLGFEERPTAQTEVPVREVLVDLGEKLGGQGVDAIR